MYFKYISSKGIISLAFEYQRRCPMGRLKTNSERKSENVKELLRDYWETLESAKDIEHQRPYQNGPQAARKAKR